MRIGQVWDCTGGSRRSNGNGGVERHLCVFLCGERGRVKAGILVGKSMKDLLKKGGEVGFEVIVGCLQKLFELEMMAWEMRS